MADALRGSMDAAEYKHVVLGLLFLECIFDAFEEPRAYVHSFAQRVHFAAGAAWLQSEAAKLDAAIAANRKKLGYGG
ncbi:MAG: hypothetical protein KJ011_11750 [Burkholderiaceae bacterium]|nr:hypothetical protein [Burkholderiaceae bacterium]